MMKFGESAARIEGSDGFVAGFVGGAIEFYERCEDYGSYGNRGVPEMMRTGRCREIRW